MSGAKAGRPATLRVWDAPKACGSVEMGALFTQTCICRAHDKAVTTVQHIHSRHGLLLTASRASPGTWPVPYRSTCTPQMLHTFRLLYSPTQMPALRAGNSLALPTQDTHTALWTLKGECIGVFGKSTWVLSDPRTWTDPLLHSMRPALRDANGKSRASITDPHQLPVGAPHARAMARSIMRRASTSKGALKPEATESSPQLAWSPRSDTSAASMATPVAEHTQQPSSVRSPAGEISVHP